MLPTLRDELNSVVARLGLPADNFRLLGPYEYQPILKSIAEHFLSIGEKGLTYNWWWEIFKGEAVGFQAYCPLKVLARVLPNQEKMWLVTNDSTKKHGSFWLYEGDAKSIVRVLEESYAFEYYVVSKKFVWLIGENHHEVLIAIGEPMVGALKREISGA